MAIREVWVGSLGPFLYDDETIYEHETSSFTGKTRRGIATDQIRLSRAPQFPEEAVRNDDERLEAVTTAIELTLEGGFGLRLVNETGNVSVPGTIVSPSPLGSEGFVLHQTGRQVIGTVYDEVENGESALVIVAGVADVLTVGPLVVGDVVCCALVDGRGTRSEAPNFTQNVGIALAGVGIGLTRVMLQLHPYSVTGVEQVLGDGDIVTAEGQVVWGA